MSSEADRVREAYAGRDPEQLYRPDDPAVRFHVEALMRELPPMKGSVLDVGCGSGDWLARIGPDRGVGIDLLEDRVELGRERHPELDLRVGDATRLPFGDDEFDFVTQFTCVSSVHDPAARAAILREMWRVGRRLVSYDLRPSPAPVRLAGRAVRSEETVPVEPLPLAEIRAALPSGTPLRARKVSLNFSLAPLIRRSPGAARALSAVPGLRSHLLVVGGQGE